mmetsp:Transcript_16333/g.42400  ORF Transcript_16333/g.42400 Transcript_16333/m.42400 type:complete len:237 (-) Transcript_16333:589-1299(-)
MSLNTFTCIIPPSASRSVSAMASPHSRLAASRSIAVHGSPALACSALRTRAASSETGPATVGNARTPRRNVSWRLSPQTSTAKHTNSSTRDGQISTISRTTTSKRLWLETLWSSSAGTALGPRLSFRTAAVDCSAFTTMPFARLARNSSGGGKPLSSASGRRSNSSAHCSTARGAVVMKCCNDGPAPSSVLVRSVSRVWIRAWTSPSSFSPTGSGTAVSPAAAPSSTRPNLSDARR